MKSYLSLFSAVALLFISCGDGTPRIQTDLEAADIHGSVQSVDMGSRRTIYNRQGYITDIYQIEKEEGVEDLRLTKIIYDQSGALPLEILNYKYFNDKKSPTIEKSEITAEQYAQRGVAERGCRYNKDGYTTQRSFYVDHEDASYKYYAGRPKYISLYFYNEENQLIELRSTRYGPVIENNDIDADSYISKGTNISKYQYNEHGDVSEVVTTIDIGKVFTTQYSYEYDQHNNWIVKKADNQEPITRIISYYEE